MTGQWLVKSGHMWALTTDLGHRTESGLCLGAISTLTLWDWVHLHYSVYRGFFILQNVFFTGGGGGGGRVPICTSHFSQVLVQ